MKLTSLQYTKMMTSPVAVPSVVITVTMISVDDGLLSTIVCINDCWYSIRCDDELLKHIADTKK